MGSSVQQSFIVLTNEDGAPGSKFEREMEEYTVDQLKPRLKCRLTLNARQASEMCKRLSKDRESSHINPSINNGNGLQQKFSKEVQTYEQIVF